MADEQSTKPKRTRRRPLSKRQLSAKVSFSNLWIPDRQLLLEIAAKRHVSEAELIREIVHQWAIKKRLAPDTEDGAEEMALLDLQRDTKASLEAGLSDIASHLKRIVDATSGYGDLLSVNEAQLTHVTSVSNAHYQITAQTFAALWFIVEMMQRDVEKSLSQNGGTKKEAIAIRDDMRVRGIHMLEKLITDCKSPQALVMALLCPSGE
jgi:hypothetical protein